MSFPPHILPTNLISPFFKYMYMIDYIYITAVTYVWGVRLWKTHSFLTALAKDWLSWSSAVHNASVIWPINQNRKTMQRKGAQTCCTDMQSFCSPWQGIGLQSQWECVGHWGQPCGVEMEKGGWKECGHGGSGLQNRALLAKFPRLCSTTHTCLIG